MEVLVSEYLQHHHRQREVSYTGHGSQVQLVKDSFPLYYSILLLVPPETIGWKLVFLVIARHEIPGVEFSPRWAL